MKMIIKNIKIYLSLFSLMIAFSSYSNRVQADSETEKAQEVVTAPKENKTLTEIDEEIRKLEIEQGICYNKAQVVYHEHIKTTDRFRKAKMAKFFDIWEKRCLNTKREIAGLKKLREYQVEENKRAVLSMCEGEKKGEPQSILEKLRTLVLDHNNSNNVIQKAHDDLELYDREFFSNGVPASVASKLERLTTILKSVNDLYESMAKIELKSKEFSEVEKSVRIITPVEESILSKFDQMIKAAAPEEFDKVSMNIKSSLISTIVKIQNAHQALNYSVQNGADGGEVQRALNLRDSHQYKSNRHSIIEDAYQKVIVAIVNQAKSGGSRDVIKQEEKKENKVTTKSMYPAIAF